MPMYNALLEYDNFPTLDSDRIDHLMGELADYHPSIGQTPDHHLEVRISIPAETEAQAAHTALAVIGAAVNFGHGRYGAGHSFASMTLLTEEEFNAREGWDDSEPDTISVTEAADILGRTPQWVRQLIRDGRFRTAARIGERSWVLQRAEVRAMASGSPNAVAVETDKRQDETDEQHIERIIGGDRCGD